MFSLVNTDYCVAWMLQKVACVIACVSKDQLEPVMQTGRYEPYMKRELVVQCQVVKQSPIRVWTVLRISLRVFLSVSPIETQYLQSTRETNKKVSKWAFCRRSMDLFSALGYWNTSKFDDRTVCLHGWKVKCIQFCSHLFRATRDDLKSHRTTIKEDRKCPLDWKRPIVPERHCDTVIHTRWFTQHDSHCSKIRRTLQFGELGEEWKRPSQWSHIELGRWPNRLKCKLHGRTAGLLSVRRLSCRKDLHKKTFWQASLPAFFASINSPVSRTIFLIIRFLCDRSLWFRTPERTPEWTPIVQGLDSRSSSRSIHFWKLLKMKRIASSD